MILDKIVQAKKNQLSIKKERIPLSDLLKDQPKRECRSLIHSIKEDSNLSILAEIKKASPSRGLIRGDFDPIKIAKTYEKCKVRGISILTETDFFLGKDEYLNEVSKKVTTPILRKDFIIDSYQIYESKVLGADAILLIKAILRNEELMTFQNISKEVGLECLVEVHDEWELEDVLKCGAQMIGINNRDLKTFNTHLKTTQKLMEYIPKDKTIISESGIHTIDDMDYIKGLGADGVLIGEAIMKEENIEKKIQKLKGH